MRAKRFRTEYTGTKLVVRVAAMTGDTLAQSSEWLEAKIELEPEWRSKPLSEIQTEALLRLQIATKNLLQDPSIP